MTTPRLPRIAALAACAALAAIAAFPSAARAQCQSMLVPMYIYPNPSTDWATADAGGARVAYMIMNPASGPGGSVDPNYVAAVAAAQAAGRKVLGYVDTSYASIAAATVDGNVDTYYGWYHVDGIFLDQVSTGSADLAYYQARAAHVRTHSPSYVALNPGIPPTDHGYLSVGDTTVVFEGSYATFQTWTSPAWLDTFPAPRKAHLVYAAPDAVAMQDAIALSRARGAGFAYVTDDVLANPWDALPSYFAAELSEMAATCVAIPALSRIGLAALALALALAAVAPLRARG